MASKSAITLPSMAPFPKAAWRAHIAPEEWVACLDAWISLAEAHLHLTSSEFEQVSARNESVATFLISYIAEMAQLPGMANLGDLSRAKSLRKACFFLSKRLLDTVPAPERLVTWDFLANFCKVYGKTSSTKLVAAVWVQSSKVLESSLNALKSSLTRQLEIDINGNPTELEQKLKKLNHLLYASPEAAALFMSGSDFIDALVSCYKFTSPALRKAIISTTYLCFIGLTDRSKPKISLLTDQLFALSATAGASRNALTNADNSLVTGFVSETPILKQIMQRVEASGTGLGRVRLVVATLENFRTTRRDRLSRPVKRINEGKGVVQGNSSDDESGDTVTSRVNVHRMSLISQIQDLFPDLGPGFITKLLDEYNDDTEQVISHLLEDSLPPHLQQAERTEELGQKQRELSPRLSNMAPRPTASLLPSRRNVFDGDEFDRLAVDTSRLHFGRRNPDRTADEILKDHSNAPSKAAILSALAAFDSNDDERDDTYDVEDVGGTVDSVALALGNTPEDANAGISETTEETLFRAFKMTPGVFDRDSTTRRSKLRLALKEETGMTDEVIEEWSLILLRDPQRMRRLEAKFSGFSGVQRELAATSWRADDGASGNEESDSSGKGRGNGKGRGRGGRSGRGMGGVTNSTSDKEIEIARKRKDTNKGSRANHNRRDQRAKKMARGGFSV